MNARHLPSIVLCAPPPAVVITLLLLAVPGPASAQLSYTGGLVRQDFDTLPQAGPIEFADFNIAKGPASLTAPPVSAAGASGWSIHAPLGTQLLLLTDTGSLGTAGTYSYGHQASRDRALGSLAGSNHRASLGWRLINHTGQTLTQFTLALFGEQWRNGGTTSLGGLEAEYRLAASGDIDSGTYLAVDPLDVPAVAAIGGSGFALNGNAAANRFERSATVTGLSWQPNQMLILRWRDVDEAGADNGIALDDVLFHAPAVMTPPEVASITPAAGAAQVLTSSRVVVTFNQPVTVVSPWWEITGSLSGAITAAVSNAGPLRWTLTPAVPFAAGEVVVVRVLADRVRNAAGQGMPEEFSASFTVLPEPGAAVTRIHHVQGGDGYSRIAGAAVTVEAVVVADFQGTYPALSGFFLQEEDEDADSDPATSEGIWVFDQGSPAAMDVTVGDRVRVTGTVMEFNAVTEISSVTAVAKLGPVPLPQPAVMTWPLSTMTDPERFEGMRIQVPQTLTVTSAGPTTGVTDNFAAFGELLLSVNGPIVIPTERIDPNDALPAGNSWTGKGNAAAIHAEERFAVLRSVILDDGSRGAYPDPTPYLNAVGTRRCGDAVTGLQGILTYSNGAYRIQPVGPVAFVDANPRPMTPPAVPGRLKAAAMNVLNYFTTFGGPDDRGASNAAEFGRQKAKIIAALTALDADVLALLEIQNDAAAVTDLLVGINAGAAGDAFYEVVPDAGNGVSRDVIRSVLLYRPAKLSPVGPCRSDDDLVWSRFPLAQVFEERETGERFIICVNHWKSKSASGASGANLDQNDGQAAYNEQRRQQAARMHAWLQPLFAITGEEDVLIVGDLNSYGEEDPLDRLRTFGYADQTARFEPDGYSYRIGGQRGRLDHAFANATMAAQITGAGHWHINADEPAFYDYNLENKSSGQKLINVGTPFRSSDHDPLVLGVSLAPQPTSYQMWAAAREWPIGAAADAGADPDGDGMANLLEFLMNTNPAVADPDRHPWIRRLDGEMRVDFRQRTTARGAVLVPQWSEDLRQWHDVNDVQVVGEVDGITALCRVRVAAGDSSLFVRFRAVESE